MLFTRSDVKLVCNLNKRISIEGKRVASWEIVSLSFCDQTGLASSSLPTETEQIVRRILIKICNELQDGLFRGIYTTQTLISINVHISIGLNAMNLLL